VSRHAVEGTVYVQDVQVVVDIAVAVVADAVFLLRLPIDTHLAPG
jgi:hypothetical protein